MKFFKTGLFLFAVIFAGCGNESGIRINQKLEYYKITGNSENELANQLNEHGFAWDDGNTYASTTAASISTHFEPFCPNPWRCIVGSFQVTVDITIALPEWQHGEDAPPELVEKWNRFMENLVLHENGHRDRAVTAATELLTAVQNLPAASSRSALEANVKALKHERLLRLAQDEADYDRDTVHGTSQGALFP